MTEQEILDMPIKQKRPVNPVKTETDQRREDLTQLISTIGIQNVRRMRKSLAQQHRCSEREIYRTIDWIKGHLKPTEDIREAQIELRIARNRALATALDALATSTNPDDRIKAIAAVIAASKHYTEQLETWNEKPKVADKINIEGGLEFYGDIIAAAKRSINNPNTNQANQGTGTIDVQHPTNGQAS
jgi:hypothetical protein